jgi:pimeloyl-ACP methyl ester carboxylesterase
MEPNIIPAPGRRKWRRVLARAFVGLISFVLVVVCGAAVYNYWAARHYRALYPAPGKLYSVDGYQMHLYCTGAGAPTIVLEAGLGNDFAIWDLVQPKLSQLTQVCSYDRAGVGWSDPRPGPRDSDSIADQLHGLLSVAQVKEPVVLMGHSVAGLHLRAYASRYPGEVAGMVLVDPSTPEQLERLPPEIIEMQRQSIRQLAWFQPLITLGIARLLRQCGDTPPRGMEGHPDWYRADNDCSPAYLPAIRGEMAGVETSAREVRHTGPFGDLPILIFSQDPDVKQPGLTEEVRARMSAAWFGLHEDLKRLSTRTRRIVAKGSTHYIQVDRPDLLNREVPLFIRQIRGELQPVGYGSTQVE